MKEQNNNNPICPICGSKMVKRTAKKGSNSGREFWGCIKYPACRGIINIETQNSTTEKQEIVKKNNNENFSINSSLISSYTAKPYEGFATMESFQSIGCSKTIMERVNADEVFANRLMEHSKFRVDYIDSNGYILTSEQRGICALLLRMLCRGRITYVSPYIEHSIINPFEDKENLLATDIALSRNVFKKDIEYCYDSEREKLFSTEILGQLFGSNWQYYFDTQVMVDSLCGNNYKSSEQRVDFIVSCGKKKYIIELDGEEHKLHDEKDGRRDKKLAEAGYLIERIDNSSFDMARDDLYQRLKTLLSFTPYITSISKDNKNAIGIAIFKLIHQVQIAIVAGLIRGAILPDEELSLNVDSDVLTAKDISAIGNLIFEDLKQQFENLCTLYQVSEFFKCKYNYSASNCISYQTTVTGNRTAKVLVSNINTIGRVSNLIPYYNNMGLEYYDEELLKYYLKYFFRHNNFREGQLDGIARVLSGKDSIILLPTGSGKSVIYQLAAMLQPGKTIVVAPLVSLMLDQVENLQMNGIECAVAVSSQNRDVGSIINDPANVLMYISPERLQLKDFRNSLSSMQVNNSICTVAIDEAHCVSEWGHDFRTAYLNIGRTSRTIFNFYGKTPTIVALTGTASTAVLKDVKRELEITDYDAVITPETFDRPELNFKVVSSDSDNKENMLEALLDGSIPDFFNSDKSQFYQVNGQKTYGGIIFCPHVNGDFGIVKVRDAVANKNISTNIYSGKAPNTYHGNWDEEKKNIARKFKQNKVNTLIATKAFGMGIDKPNVAFTIHYGIPGSIESFYQEAGRAARGKNMKALCSILLSTDNANEDNELLDPSTPLERITEIINDKKLEEQDDISRMLFFHINSFRGVNFELMIVEEIINKLYVEERLTTKAVIVSCKDKKEYTLNNVQKAIQRLLVLGIIKDYIVNYSADEVIIYPGRDSDNEIREKYATYVKGYNEGRVEQELDKLGHETTLNTKQEYVIHAARILTEFIYDTIEKGRRRGLAEMRNATEAALQSKTPDATLRERVVRYFETTYAEQLFYVVEDENLGFGIIPTIMDGEVVDENGGVSGGIRAANEAAGLRGGTSRFLESTPDHPGLLILRALAELYCKDYDDKSIINDIRSACQFAIDRYSQTQSQLAPIIQYFMIKVLERNENLYEPMLESLNEYIDEVELNGFITEEQRIPERVRLIPAKLYFNQIGKKVISIVTERKGEL